ncbi:MAG: zinc ribbon domain-containing protein [Lachnospiraceae bacterium]|nr:zinc ribbon domain-containing protein [Lachnospiraceae bacterium]
MFCNKCGAEVKGEAQFCPKCGTKVKESIFPKNDLKEKNFNIEQLLQKCGIDRLLQIVTKQQIICIGAAVLTVILGIALISGIRKGSNHDTAYIGQKNMGQGNAESPSAGQKSVKQENEEKNIGELTLNEQLSLMKEYMDTGDIREEELVNVMVEQHLYEPDLYLGLAEIMIARDHSDSAIDVLVTGYQYTNDEQIRSKLLDLQTRVKVGDENADKIDKALSIAEDIAEDIGYGETVEKGKNLFDTLYGVYLENK